MTEHDYIVGTCVDSTCTSDNNIISCCTSQLNKAKELIHSLDELKLKRSLSSSNLPTPIKANRLKWYLKGYDTHLSNYLLQGFSQGFKLNNFSSTPTDSDKVLKSASSNPDVVNVKLEKELKLGRLIGPFKNSPFKNHVISPLGIVEKKTPGEYRVIHHLSYPSGLSINDGIPREYASVKYTSITDAISKIVQVGKNAYLAKSDIKSAFRIIPINPSDYHLLGMKWQGNYYFDRCLPMGASSSCSIFEKFSSALEWIVQGKIGNAFVLHVLDDFLFIANNYDECHRALEIFLKICKDIGVPIAPEKTFYPTQIIQFLGIELNTIDMYSSIPDEKVEKFSKLIDEFLVAKSVTLKKLQSLTGMLNFCCGVINPARIFSRRLYNLTIGVSKHYHHVKLTIDVKDDLLVWKKFLSQYNKRTFFLDYIWKNSTVLKLYTDASTSVGYGAVFGDHWFSGVWDKSCNGLHISILELYPICAALDIWGECLRNKCINIISDNMAVVCVINSFTSKDKYLMKLLRHMVFTCMKYNILIKSTHLPGKLNIIAEKISRGQVQQALELAPYLEKEETKVPSYLSLPKLLEI